MTDIKERLIDGMRGQGIILPDGDWLRLNDNNLTLIAERLQRTPGVAVVEVTDQRLAAAELALDNAISGCASLTSCVHAVLGALLAAAVQAQEEQP